ncbi:hypothetical protein [Pedobacter frigoris]|uniref:Uncharacterized protein n=1 Tax=Pedobacter frigoris TaxID=2571272 RepID=A0A4U1CQN6_9SPHI|nr:hypothetical protein [Pedobacter frigoris]TKC09666.1 hypothetical protein FA047_06170 [Pedobacter frigoris]
MKTLLLVCSFVFASFSLSAQEGVAVDQIIGHWDLKDIPKAVGKEVVIVDSVYDGRAFENHTLLNVGGKYPGQIISVFIAKKDYKNFSDDILKLYLHKKISVSGKLSIFNEKAQIVVTDPKQINSHLNYKKKVLNVIF